MKCLYPIAEHPVYSFEMPVIASNMYLLPMEDSCLIVDPFVSGEAAKLLQEKDIKECLVLLTHEHLDHISGVNWLRSLYPCKVLCSEACGERITDPRKSGAAYFEALFFSHSQQEQKLIGDMMDLEYACEADQTYSGEMEFQWQGLAIKLRETPGHSLGSQIISVNYRFFFTGDSLIPGQAVITRLPGGSKKDFKEKALPYLQSMPEDSVIFPGHESEGLLSEIKSCIKL